MKALTASLLSDLARISSPPCVTMYLPLDPGHPDIEANRLELKEMIRSVRSELETTTELRRPEVVQLLVPAEELLASTRWPLGSKGYALFGAPGLWVSTEVSIPVAPLGVVSSRFVITPLVGAVDRAEARFYVLVVGREHTRLLRGHRFGLTEVDAPGMPHGVFDALWYEHHERHLNVHGGSHHGADRIVGTVHGSGSENDLRKSQLRRFLTAVNDAVVAYLRDERAPLVLAGVDYEVAQYRDVNRYPNLVATAVTGNVDQLSHAELHTRALPLAAQVLDRPRQVLLERLRSSALATTDLAAVLRAAREGRVEALLVRRDRLQWGTVDARGVIDEYPQRRPGAVELLGVAVAEALDQGAVVLPAFEGELPDAAPIAALLRF